MKVLKTIEDVQSEILSIKKNGKRIGFVPTMGALHQGHISLVKKSRAENDISVVSIFVNPTQFNEKQDYENYPKNLESDINFLKKEGCDLIFIPTSDIMYPDGLEETIDFDPGFLDTILEGEKRPGHFKGVATVVKKLFDIIRPHSAYFGQKDYQQTLVIRKLVYDFRIPVKLIICPIIREVSGLAMSSRNSLCWVNCLLFSSSRSIAV